MKSVRAKTAAKRSDFNLALWVTMIFFGATPVLLGVSLGLADYFHLVH
jgi:hypothetical protein